MKKLKPEEDAFGQEMWACYKGEEAAEIVERDDGYFDASPKGPKHYFSEYENWHPIEKKAMKHVKGRVLDIGCGAGRHSLYLQKKRFDVLGIDNSPLAIKICKLRGLKKAEIMSIEELDFKRDSFDTIIMMGNNFGLFGGFKKARRLLKKFHKMTSEKGLIIASTRDTYKTDNPDHLEYHRRNKEKGRMAGQLRFRIRFRKYVGRWFDYLIASKREMESILQGTGWKIREYIDSDNSEYIAIIEKKLISSNKLKVSRARVVEVLGYIVLSTVVFLLLGFAVYELFPLQQFYIDLPMFFALEGCIVMIFGASLTARAPADVTTNRLMSWVPIHQLRESPKGAVIFGCSGFLIFVIGMLLTLTRSLIVTVNDVTHTLTVELIIMILAVIVIGVLAAVFLLRRRKTE